MSQEPKQHFDMPKMSHAIFIYKMQCNNNNTRHKDKIQCSTNQTIKKLKCHYMNNKIVKFIQVSHGENNEPITVQFKIDFWGHSTPKFEF